ncbi:MAG: enoyl-CoA hydratase/isomerase family protein [Elusimicrobia bacterium]|nr:enoyl-CoA hydratase/isomerase family protein [Elusimicrobiota bacterium]
MSYQTIQTDKDKDSFRLILNRPPLNILNIAALEEMRSALAEALEGSHRFLLLKASGKAFSAGVDVADHLPDKVGQMMASFHESFYLLNSFPGLVISCVQGPALGGGCELAIAADIVLVSSEAKFGQPEIRLGVFPPVATILLPRLCPPRIALELILSGETVTAAEALRLGIVNKVFEGGRFQEGVEEYLGKYREMSLSSIKIAKRALRKIHPEDFKDKLRAAEEIYLNTLMRTDDAKEGSLAFLQKRKPVWNHS